MNGPLLSMRAALILLMGLLVGMGAGILTALAGAVVAQAFLAGAAAFGVAVPFFHRLVGCHCSDGREPRDASPSTRR